MQYKYIERIKELTNVVIQTIIVKEKIKWLQEPLKSLTTLAPFEGQNENPQRATYNIFSSFFAERLEKPKRELTRHNKWDTFTCQRIHS